MPELICPTCGLGIAEGSRFCSQCGVPLSVNQPVETDNNHRDSVLQSLRALMPQPLADKLNAAAPEIIGERREVTVLFLDIVNFTATSHVLDSEEIYIWTDRAMRLLAEVIYKYEGTIDKYTGDGLMALFGVPVAHENDPARAIRAALDMLFALEPLQTKFKAKYGLDLQVRIGINTGTVIAGKIGSDLHVEVTVIGNTVNLANRLQSVAEPNTIAASFETYQRTHPLFDFIHLPPITVKGKPEPIRVFQPLRLRERPRQIRGIPGLLVPMVGREQALSEMQNALADMRQFGRSQIILVTGEAGVGKSRLVKEFSESVSHSGISIHQGVCLTYTRTNPLRLMASLLRDLMQLSEADPVEVQYAALRVYLDQLELDTDDLAPFLVNVLGFEQEYPMIQAFLNRLDSTVLQKQIHSALRQVLLTEIAKEPTVLVFDDLHWVDPASRDFLEHFIQTMDGRPLMLILISRDFGPQTAVHSLITSTKSRHKHLIDIKLEPLTEKEGQQLVNQLLKLTSDKAIVLKRRISERAEGNPFYAEEIIRMLIDQGGLKLLNGQWHLEPQVDQLLQKVPSTLNGLVSARLDSLSDDLRQTLQKAAILGSDFPLHLLQTLTSLDSKVITAQMDELVTKQFLIDLPLWQRQGYTFRHALVQKIIYNTLLKRDRQSIHTQVAEAIKQDASWLPYDKIEALAYHFSESTHPISALPYLVDAAERAARRCANETAVQHYRKALALIKDQTDRDECQALRIQMGLGQALKFLGEFAEASQILEDSLQQLLSVSIRFEIEDLLPILIHSLKELADIRVREGALDTATSHLQAGLDALGEQGSEKHPHFWRSLMDRLAWVRFRQGDLKNSFTLASSATLNSDSDTDEDPMTLASLYNTLGGIFWQWGNLSEASRFVERSLRLHQSLAYAWGMAIAYTNLGILHYAVGRWPEAEESFSHAFTLRRDNGYLPEKALNLCNLGQLRIAMGDHTQARKDLEDGLAISKQLGEEFGIVLAKIGLGQLAVIQSQFEQAVDHIGVVLDMAEAAGDHQVAHAGWLMALSQAGLGDLNLGIKTAEAALETARIAGLTATEADCCRALGVLHIHAGNYMDAEALLREAVDLCLQVKVPYGQGLALYELGLLYHTLADIDDTTQKEWNAKAVNMLEQSEKKLELLGANYDLKLTRAALGEIQSEMALEELLCKEINDSSPHQISVQSENLPKGDRRPVTIVCLSLRPPKDADEEIIFDFMTHHLQVAATISAEYQGQVIRRKNGLTLVFGAPKSYEDDAIRAVQTAYQLRHRLPLVGEKKEIVTDFGIAVSQGDVIVGHIGSEIHTEFSVTGEAVRMAEKLADATPSGRILVTDKVRVSTERMFIYQPVGDIKNLPITESTLAEIIDLREHPEPARGLPGLQSRLIGRENQLQKMLELSKILNQGVGGLIWIEGEPGVGKSRLIAEFSNTIAKNGILLWDGASSPQKSDHAFSLISNVLARALNVRSIDTPDQIRAKINQGMQNWPRDAMLVRSYLEILLGLRPSGLEAERLASLEPEQLRQQVFVSFRRLLKILGAQRPLVLVLDDLHWIDPMSAELLMFLVTLVVSVPILFVCAQRRQGVDSPNDRLVKVQSLIPTQTIQIHLPRLTETECQDLLHELLPQVVLPTSLLQNVLQRSEGNPYFIEECVRMLIAQGYLQQTDGGWQVNTGQDISDLPIPPSLEVLVRSRIDALPSDLKQILQEASVIGTPIDIGLLNKVSEISNVENEINRLVSRLLMVRIPETNQWHFSHHMIQTVAYNTMLKVRREAIHLKVAEVMEIQWAQNKEDHAEELAYHFTQSGYSSKAISYLIMAGERAITHYANEEAISFFERADKLMDADSDAADDLHWRIAAGLGDAYRAVGRHADSVATLKEGLTLTLSAKFSNNLLAGLYRRLGETYRKQGEMDIARELYKKALSILSASTNPQTPIERARCQIGIAWTYFLQGQSSTAQESCKNALDAAREVGSLAELATAENLMGGIHYHQSEWIPALHHTTRAMVLREQMGYTWGVASTLGNLGILAVTAGQWNKAWSFFERSLALQQEIGDIEGLTIAHNNLGSLARDQGKLNLAEHHFRESLRVATPFEMAYHIANSSLGLAHVMLLMGLLALAQEAVAKSQLHAQDIGAEALLVETLRIQAEIFIAKDNLDEARKTITDATTLAAQLKNRSLEAASWRVASEIDMRKGDPQAAQKVLVKAQDLVADGTDELEYARIAAQMGRIYLFREHNEKGEVELRRAREIFIRLGANLELERVEETLRELSMANHPVHH